MEVGIVEGVVEVVEVGGELEGGGGKVGKWVV